MSVHARRSASRGRAVAALLLGLLACGAAHAGARGAERIAWLDAAMPGLLAAQGRSAWRALGWGIESGGAGDIYQHGGANSTGFRAFVQFSRTQRSALVLFMNGVGGSAARDAVVAAIGDP